MKKMFFTAIALVAFTGVSMANTKEVKKTEEKNTKNEEKKEVLVYDYCDGVWVRRANFEMETGSSMADAIAIANWYEARCREREASMN